MVRRALRALVAVVGVVSLVGGVLYLFGLRLVPGGSGVPRLSFVKSRAAQADAIERHRAAQRASVPAEVPAAAAPQPAPSEAEKPALVPNPGTAWTGFRGPSRDGTYRETAILTSWPANGLKPLWKQPVGEGYASFAIGRGRAFTIEQRRHEEVVAAYDVASGRELWTNRWTAEFRELMGGDGPRATPVWSDGLVCAVGSLGELRCLDDATGRVVWRTNILEENGASNLQWGVSASPLVVGDTVVVVPGGPGGRSVVAYDRRTGTRVWSAQDDKAAYASPMLVTLAGTRQLLVFSASRLMGLTPGRGDVLWEYPWTTEFDINAAQPVVIGDNRVFVSSGYGAGAAVIEITRSTARAVGRDEPSGRDFTVREIWRNIRMKNKFASSVLHEGFIYGLDENILACVDAATGALKWKGGRYGYGQVILASGQLVVLTEGGDLVLVRATPTAHEEIARSSAIAGKTWNVPTLSGGILLVRNLQEMAAFDLRK